MKTFLHFRHVVKNTRPIDRVILSLGHLFLFLSSAMDAAPRLASASARPMDDRSTGRCGCHHGPQKKPLAPPAKRRNRAETQNFGGFGELGEAWAVKGRHVDRRRRA